MNEGFIDSSTHEEHHKFLSECIPLLRDYLEQQKRNQEQWDKFRSSFFGAIATALAVGTISVFAWVGQVVLEALKH